MSDAVRVGGPYFNDLHRGQVFDTAPSVTLTEGMAATHQAILGDRLRLPLDRMLSEQVTGQPGLAHSALVTDLAIGQSTLVTHHVKANLFYRGLRLLHHPHIGDTLTTRTTVAGLRRNSLREGRAPTGLVALHMHTTDQTGRPVLDFHRCAMLPLSPHADPESCHHTDDLSAVGNDNLLPPPSPEWDLTAFRATVGGEHFSPDLAGRSFLSSGDVVSSAPELARLTLNVAATHHDDRATGSRLVYGGHTIGIAMAQASRALPNLVTLLSWDACDHTGPVHEGDTLTSELTVLAAEPRDSGGAVRLRSIVHAHSGSAEPRPVLDWHFWALMA